MKVSQTCFIFNDFDGSEKLWQRCWHFQLWDSSVSSLYLSVFASCILTLLDTYTVRTIMSCWRTGSFVFTSRPSFSHNCPLLLCLKSGLAEFQELEVYLWQRTWCNIGCIKIIEQYLPSIGVLQSMGSQRVGHSILTEQQQQIFQVLMTKKFGLECYT